MDRLTPELWAISSLASAAVGGAALETRELDFNLARRSAVVINQVRGMLSLMAGTTTGFDPAAAAVQELDMDPDNVDIQFGAGIGGILHDDVELDSSRVFRQVHARAWDTAAGATGSPGDHVKMDWTNLPMEQRPISITNMRHHLRMNSTINNWYWGELYIKYFIVELSLLELGILNATRR